MQRNIPADLLSSNGLPAWNWMFKWVSENIIWKWTHLTSKIVITLGCQRKTTKNYVDKSISDLFVFFSTWPQAKDFIQKYAMRWKQSDESVNKLSIFSLVHSPESLNTPLLKKMMIWKETKAKKRLPCN